MNLNFFFPVACSHDRAWEFFAESVINPVGFPSLRCENYESFTNGTCFKDFAYSKKQKMQYMGLAVNKQYVVLYRCHWSLSLNPKCVFFFSGFKANSTWLLNPRRRLRTTKCTNPDGVIRVFPRTVLVRKHNNTQNRINLRPFVFFFFLLLIRCARVTRNHLKSVSNERIYRL